MKISIITVTYNAQKYLQDCIDSVNKQGYDDIEHIIIDGKSSDNTLSIIQANSHTISKWTSEEDNGMYHAINKGLALATGDIVGILNSDDILASDQVISKIAEAFTNDNIDALYGDLQYVTAYNTERVVRKWIGKPFNKKLFKQGWMPAHPTFYMKRELVKEYGGYENHFKTAADYEFMARYLYKNNVNAYYLPNLIVKMRCGGQSNKSWYARIRANRRDYLAMKKNGIPLPLVVSILKPLSKLHQFAKLPAAAFFNL